MRTLLSFILRFFQYYTSSRLIRLRSAYSPAETRERLLRLQDGGDVFVQIHRTGEISLGARVRRAGVGPTIRIQILEEHGHGLLVGEVGLPWNLRFVMGGFGVTALFFMAMQWREGRFYDWCILIGFMSLFLLVGYATKVGNLSLLDDRVSEALGVPAGLE